MSDLATLPAPVFSHHSEEISERSRKILEATTDVVAMTDADGRLLYLNATGRRLLGLTQDESLGQSTLSALQPPWACEVVMHDAIPTSLASGSWSGETALLSGNGTELPVLQIVLAHKGMAGDVEFFSTVCRDITDRKQKELESIEWANRYDAAVRASGQLVFDWDTVSDAIIYRGDTGQLLGIAPSAMGARLADLHALMHPEDRPGFDEAIEEALLTRNPFYHEFRAVRPYSTEIIIETQGCFFLNRKGQLNRAVGFLRDVTKERESARIRQLANEDLEQKVKNRTADLQQANNALERGEGRQALIAKLGLSALSGIPADKLMSEAVNAVCEMLPADCSSLLQFNGTEGVFHCLAEAGWPAPETSPTIPALEDSQSSYTLRIGAPVIAPDLENETRFRVSESVRAAGAKSRLTVCIKTGESAFGVLTAFSLARTDYSSDDVNFVQAIANVLATAIERRNAEEQIRQAQSDAEVANRAKTEFLSRMSHELRTPLNAVLGFTQLLEMEEHTERQSESITHISRAGRNLLDLINEILDIARLDAGRVKFNMETVDVMELLRQVVTATLPAAAKQKIELRIAETGGEEPFVSVDRERLKQVLVNLLSNAVKFNQDGGSITLAVARMDPGKWRISVTDTGIGIPQDKISRLFVPFERLGTREGGTEGGTGLGLALCQRLVRALDGRIGVASSPGLGSTFWVELPAAEVAPVQAAPSASRETGSSPEAGGEAHRILYIEDDSTNFYLLDRILASRKGIKLLSALRGELGLGMVREHRPELILLDMNLPDMSGEQVLRALKGDPATASIPVIPVTGDALGDRGRELTTFGITEVIQKPYRVAEIMALIDRLFPSKV